MAQNIFKPSYIKIINFVHQRTNIPIRNFASVIKDNDKKPQIKKSVFVSQSYDIFSNLALEDWLYKNFDFTNHHVLLLWQNDPCVVIGRHQNPWLEANVTNLNEQGIAVARRCSGGGTVYHDRGNLNLTFFTSRDHYNRTYNLELITRALFRKYGVHAAISPRQDLTIRDNHKQVSGTAAKLGRPNAYHHCTLLVNVNKLELSQALQKRQTDINTNATKSIPSPVINLCEENPNITVDCMLEAIGWEYLRTDPLIVKDGGAQFISKQGGFQLVNPTEQWFPGLANMRANLSSWEWCYGKTPKFSMSRSFPVPSQLLPDQSSYNTEELKITVQVENGRIGDVILHIPPGLNVNGLQGDVKVITSLKQCKFTEDAIDTLECSLSTDNILAMDKNNFVTECVRQVMTSVS